MRSYFQWSVRRFLLTHAFGREFFIYSPVTMNLFELREASDHSVVSALRHFAVHADGAALSQGGSALLVASDRPYDGPFHNAGFRTSPHLGAHSTLAELREFGWAHHRRMTLWTGAHRDDDLAAVAVTEGLPPSSTAVGMATKVCPPEPEPPDGIALTQVRDLAGVADFAEIHQELMHRAGDPTYPVAHFASPGALLAADVTAFVARSGGRPLACAMVLHSGRVAGVYRVATRPEARRRGLGELVARAATTAGFRRGASVVVLQATPQGEPVYRRLGFQPVTSYHRYLVAPTRVPVAVAA